MSKKVQPETIYHYTSNDVLLKLLSGKSLRMSARHHLNDTMEGEQFFALLAKHDSRPDAEKIEAIRQALSPFEFFVACFSAKRDLLSQWRGYTGNGTGVSVGFSTQSIRKAIKGNREALLYPVVYADDFHSLPQPRASTIDAILTSPGAPGKPALQSFSKERWAIKPKGFSEEEEYRLIITIDTSSGSLKPVTNGLHVGYYAASSEVREYCDFRFGDFPDLKFATSITLGPNNKTDERALQRYLASIGLSDIDILRSGISYR